MDAARPKTWAGGSWGCWVIFFPRQFTVQEAFYASAVELIKVLIISLPFVLIIATALYQPVPSVQTAGAFWCLRAPRFPVDCQVQGRGQYYNRRSS